MAKDTEKLIRQLSLISYLMAERRPVTALEIRRDVEGYSGMNEDAFARRFYADRSELESLRIQLTVERPADGAAEQENYSLRPENFHLPAIEFTDKELAALQTALSLLDGEFAYAEPLRLALQQITWGRPSPLRAPEQRSVALGITGSAGGHELSARLAKVETAIFRNKTILFDYYTMERDEVGAASRRPLPPALPGRAVLPARPTRTSARRSACSACRGSAARSPTRPRPSTTSAGPADFDPRAYANRADWQLGEEAGVAEIADLRAHRLADRTPLRPLRGDPPSEDGETVFATGYSSPRGIISWVLGLGENARLLGPEELTRRAPAAPGAARGAPRRGAAGAAACAGAGAPRRRRRGIGGVARTRAARRGERRAPTARAHGRARGRDPPRALRAPGDAREHPDHAPAAPASACVDGGGLRAPADQRRGAARGRQRAERRQLRRRLLRAVRGDQRGGGEIEVDPEPYSDNFDRPARLLPVEAKALVAAIDLIGEHIPEGSLTSARDEDRGGARRGPDGAGPAGGADRRATTPTSRGGSPRRSSQRKLIELEYYKENEDELSLRTVEPYALTNGREGWYVASFDPARDGVRHFRLDRIKRSSITDEKFEPRPEVDPAAEVDGWLRTGEVPASAIARVWVSPERARWAREARRVVERVQRRLGDRRAELRRRRLARARDPQGSRRRRRARARGGARGGAGRRRPGARGELGGRRA